MYMEDRKMINSDVERLIALIRDGKIVLWAGSGLSLYAGYPSGAEFCNIICNAAKTMSDKEILLRHKPSLMDTAEEFEQLYSRNELIGLVSTHFDKSPCVYPCAHSLCAQIPQIDTIITTNYDHLFEQVYGDSLCTVIGTQFKVPGKDMVTLYKIHGDSSDSASVVLTSKDYAKFYNGINSLVWGKLKSILAEYSVLFIGYSLEDKNIEEIFEKVLTQVETSSEFFIAVPELAEHKLRHFNTICKTTHLPIYGETLLQVIEKAVRENIVFDAIEKKISIDQAQAIAYKHGVEPTWRSTPIGGKTKTEIEGYTFEPSDTLIFNGVTISSSQDTFGQMQQFFDDCDCREMILPPESVQLFENVNGIKIPQNVSIDGKPPAFFKVKKSEQIDKAALVVSNNNIYKDSITIHSFLGNKRKRITVQLPTLRISLLFEDGSINITFSFVDRRSAKKTLDDLVVLALWNKGATLEFVKPTVSGMEYIAQMPPLEDEFAIAGLSNFIDKNTQIHTRVQKLEHYLKKEFLLPEKISCADRDAILKVLSVFEPVDVGDTFKLYLPLEGHEHLYEILKSPSCHPMRMTEKIEEQVCLFGYEFIIKEQQISISSPVIENADEVSEALLLGKEAVARIGSSTGKTVMCCKL